MAYMDKALYWFFDAVVEYKLPIQILAASNLAEVLNRPSHGLDPKSISTLLLQLVQQDYLVIYHCNPLGPSEVPFIPSLRDLEEELDTPKSTNQEYLAYGLSPLGGAQWEILSSPRWDRFISTSYATDPYEAEIIAQDRQLVQRYFEVQHYTSSSVGVVIPESMQWDTLHPWQATYWKTLPYAYRLRFFYHPYPEDLEVPAISTWAWEQLGEMREWYQRYSPREGN
jgi:hypothetical protein